MTFKHYMALKDSQNVLEEKKKKKKKSKKLKRSSKYYRWGYFGYGYPGIYNAVADVAAGGDGAGE
jgi:hypothetical protein